MLIPQFDSRVSRHITGYLLLVRAAVYIVRIIVFRHVPVIRVVIVTLAHTLFTDIARAHIQRDKLYVRVQIRLRHHRCRKHISRHHDHIRSARYCLINTCVTRFVGIAVRFVVGKINAVGLRPRLTGFIGGLVKTLVRNVTGIGDHGKADIRTGCLLPTAAGLFRFSRGLFVCRIAAAAARRQGKCHCSRQKHGDHLSFHKNISSCLISLITLILHNASYR